MRFDVAGKIFESYHVLWEIVELDRVSDVKISSTGSGATRLISDHVGQLRGEIDFPTIRSTTEKYKLVWLRDKSGREFEVRLEEDFAVRKGHVLKFSYIKSMDDSSGDHGRPVLISIENVITKQIMQFCKPSELPIKFNLINFEPFSVRFFTKKRISISLAIFSILYGILLYRYIFYRNNNTNWRIPYEEFNSEVAFSFLPFTALVLLLAVCIAWYAIWYFNVKLKIIKENNKRIRKDSDDARSAFISAIANSSEFIAVSS